MKDISLKIPAYNLVGFVGSTGSSKTITIDIILGLLKFQKGTIDVDDKIINKNNLRAWQSQMGYVPHEIYLADKSIEANIAFGVEPQNINYKAVEYATKIANLHIFDCSPFKYSKKM